MKYDYGLKPLKFWCQKVLPLVYDESLSYEELLCKVVAYLNEVIEGFNGIPEYIQSLVSDERLQEILSELLNELEEQIAPWNEQENENATKDMTKGELVWLNNKLYQMTRDILAGDKYVIQGGTGVTPNVTKVTIEGLIGNLANLTTDEKGNLVGSINELLSKLNVEKGRIDSILDVIGDTSELTTEDKSSLVDSINEVNAKAGDNGDNIGDLDNLETTNKDNLVDAINEIISNCGDLENLSTTDKTSLVSAINEVVTEIPTIDYVTPQDYGAVGDGVTDDTNAVQDALDSGKHVKFISNYAVTSVTYNGSANLIDFNDYTLFGISTQDDFVLVIESAMYNIFKSIKIDAKLSTTYYGCIQVVSTAQRQSQYNLFFGMFLLGCWHGLVWGAKEGESSVYNAQSETYIFGFRDRSVAVPFLGNQQNGYLNFIGSNFDTVMYESWDDSRFNTDDNNCVRNLDGAVVLTGCEFACTNNVNHIGLVGKDIYAYDSIIECAGTQIFATGNIDFIGWSNGFIGQVTKTPIIINNDAEGVMRLKDGIFHYPDGQGATNDQSLIYGYDAPKYKIFIEDVVYDNVKLNGNIFGHINTIAKNLILPYQNITINTDNDITGLSYINDLSDGIATMLNNPDSLTITTQNILSHKGIDIQYGAGGWQNVLTDYLPIFGGVLLYVNCKGICTTNQNTLVYVEYFDDSFTNITGEDALVMTITNTALNRNIIVKTPSTAKYCRLKFTNGNSGGANIIVGDIKVSTIARIGVQPANP